MRFNTFSAILGTCGLASSVLLLAGGAAFAQSVNLTAGSASAVLPDGQSVPMWGYTCGTTAGPDVANTPSCVNSTDDQSDQQSAGGAADVIGDRRSIGWRPRRAAHENFQPRARSARHDVARDAGDHRPG